MIKKSKKKVVFKIGMRQLILLILFMYARLVFAFDGYLQSQLYLDWQQSFTSSESSETAKNEFKHFQPKIILLTQSDQQSLSYNLAYDYYKPNQIAETPTDYIYLKESVLGYTYLFENKNLIKTQLGYFLNDTQKNIYLNEDNLDNINLRQIEFVIKNSQNLNHQSEWFYSINVSDVYKVYDFHQDHKYFEFSIEQKQVNTGQLLKLSYIQQQISQLSSEQKELFNQLELISINEKLIHQDQFKTSYLALNYQKQIDEKKSFHYFITLFDQTILDQTFRGLKTFLKPTYNINESQKVSALLQYENTYIKQSKPKKIVYGVSFTQNFTSDFQISLSYLDKKIDSQNALNEKKLQVNLTYLFLDQINF